MVRNTKTAMTNEVVEPAVAPPTTGPEPEVAVVVETVEPGPFDYQEAYERRQKAEQERVIAILSRPTALDEIKVRKGGGGKDLRYISGDVVIKRLIEATRGDYDVDLVEIGEEGAKVIFFELEQGGKKKPAMLVCVRLTIPNLGSKIGFGVQVLQGGEDMYKGALTDGLKKAATQLGLGLDLFDENYVPEEPVVELTPKQIVTRLMKDRGITKAADANAKAQEKYGKDFKDLTDTEFTQWADSLAKEPPF